MPTNQSEFLFHVVEEDGRTAIWFPAGTSLSEINADEFARELLALVDGKERPHLVVDLGGVVMLTSVILSLFLTLNRRVRDLGGRLSLFNPAETIHQVFRVTRLDTVLELHPYANPLPV
jgi:anti-anti-sigma factor